MTDSADQFGMFDALDGGELKPGSPRSPRATSSAAKGKVASRALTLRERAFGLISDHTLVPYYGGLTADEVAGLIGENVLAIRPRITELRDAGLIVASDRRRQSSLGNSSVVWMLKPRGER